MTVLLATTTVSIDIAVEAEPGEGRTWSYLADTVPAQIGAPKGGEDPAPGGGRQQLRTDLVCDYIEGFDHTCRVTDDITGEIWDVEWVKLRIGVGLDHMRVQLIRWEGGGR